VLFVDGIHIGSPRLIARFVPSPYLFSLHLLQKAFVNTPPGPEYKDALSEDSSILSLAKASRHKVPDLVPVLYSDQYMRRCTEYQR
jgi:hypothetical protein